MCKLVYDRPQMVHDMFTALKSTPPDLCLDDMKQSLIQVGCLTLQSTPSPKHRSTHPTLTSTSLPSPGHSLTHTRSSTLTRARPSPRPIRLYTPITYSVSVFTHDFSSLFLPNP